jgi:2-polyprenyl-3-methyl-5-hydroxy-6-metoxy-1,4-benzoquinol methylase
VLDPDPRAAAHARERVGVEAVQGDFMRAKPFGRFQLVTLNKVLEHVADPVAMLERTRGYLRDGGVTYVEVPDGEAASLDDPGREEFFVEHLHAFTAASLALTALRAGYAVQRLDRLREPSTKYTLVAFLRERAA